MAALLFLLQSSENLREKDKRNFILLAGALFGISAGLKLTSLAFTFGAAIALLLTTRGWKLRILAMIYFSLAWLTMFGIVYGWWGYKLWQSFGNPVFPFYNKIFASSWIPIENFSDGRFMPKSIFQAIFYPFFWLNPRAMVVAEVEFSDFRYSFAYLGIIILIGSVLYRKLSQTKLISKGNSAANSPENKIYYMLIIFVVISYAFWEYAFSVLRYAVPIEILSGIVFALGIKESGLIEKCRISITLLIALGLFVLMITTSYPEWGRINYDPSETFIVDSPTLPENSLVLLASPPISFITPFVKMSDGVSPEFIGIDLYSVVENFKLGQLIRTRIQSHKGPIFVVALPTWSDWSILNSEFGISVHLNACRIITSNRDPPLNLCPAN